jgi:hypothetical protein
MPAVLFKNLWIVLAQADGYPQEARVLKSCSTLRDTKKANPRTPGHAG